MLKLLEFLWSGCWHKWEDLRTANVTDDRKPPVAWTRYYTRCTKCGAHKTWD